MNKKEFCKACNITEKQFYGEEKIGGYLDLRGLTSIPAGFNPTVGGGLDLSGLTSIPAGFNPTVGGYLDLRGLTSIPAGFNPTVGGSLYLSGLTSIPAGFNPTVGGSLYLSGLTSIPAGFNPTVGGSLYLSGLTSIPAGFNPTVGGYLDLRGLTSIPVGFNPTVGGYLDLNGLTSIPVGFNPTVVGSLYLSGLTSIPVGFNPTVGGYLDLNGLTSIPAGFNPTVGGYLDLRGGLKAKTKPLSPKHIFSWQEGKYIMLDNILTEVIHKHGDTYKIKVVGKTTESYLVIKDGFSAHGETLKKAKEDLQFKIAAETLKKEPIKADTLITINHYRLITGACEFGVKNWMEQNGLTGKEKMKAKDLLPLLEKTGAWGVDRFKQLVTF